MTDRLALPRRYRDQLEALLSEHVPGVEVWAYGSRVNGESHEGSDLDLVLRGPALEPLDRGFYDLLEAIEKSNIPILVQTHDWAMLPESFHREIEQAYVIVQSGAKKAAAEWIHCTLADVCSAINYGLTASASSRSDGPKFLRITDIVSGQPNWNSVPHVEADDDTMAKYRLYDGDIVIARTGASTGTSAYVRNPPPSVFASYLVRLQARPEFDARFLAYYLKSEEFWEYIRGVLGDKSAQPNASASTMTAAPFRAPKNKAEQRAIAHVLGTLDDKIELNRRMNETLEAMARALFKSWFVDFYPVRAKMDGRWHPGESLPGLPAEHYDLFPDRLVDSELGEIPEGWETKALGDVFVAENVRLGSVDVPEYSCTNEGLIPRSDRFKKKLSMSNSKNKVISKGDFVFGLSRRVLNFGLMRDGIGCVSPAYRTYSTNQDLVIPDLLERMMRLHSEYFYIAVSASSREGQSISQDALYGLKVSLPTIAIQHHLNHLLKRISLRSAHGLKENDRLGILRDTLLPKLVSGEVRMGQE